MNTDDYNKESPDTSMKASILSKSSLLWTILLARCDAYPESRNFQYGAGSSYA